MVYIESPAGVGYNEGSFFSMKWDDESVSYDNLNSTVEFFRRFPELREKELYLSGESYAGIYVPYLALRILEWNDLHPEEPINLKGIMIGNGVTHWQYDTAPALVEMAYAHGLIGFELQEKIKSHPECNFADVGAPSQSLTC